MKLSHMAIFILAAGFAFPSMALDLVNGRKIYERHCMGCHSPAGQGVMPNMPNFERGDRLFKTDRELIDSVRDGNGVMPSFNGILDDRQMEDVVAYLRTFL